MRADARNETGTMATSRDGRPKCGEAGELGPPLIGMHPTAGTKAGCYKLIPGRHTSHESVTTGTEAGRYGTKRTRDGERRTGR